MQHNLRAQGGESESRCETVSTEPGARRHHSPWLAWGGFLTSGFAMLSYFLIVPRISIVLRDSGHANVALGGLGVALALAGVVSAVRAGIHRKAAIICCVASVGLTGGLAYYIYALSYQLPSAERVLAIGARAPDFRLKDQDGVDRSLASFTSKRLILVFFRGHW